MHRADSLGQFITYGSTPLLAASPVFCFSAPPCLPASINMTSSVALYKLFFHSGNICSLNSPAEMSLGEIALHFMRNLSFKPSEGPGREGTLGLTLVLCCFSGILRKNVVSDFVDCQNEARWQWIKCNAVLLFLGSRLRFPLSEGALPAQQPQPCVPLATENPFPWAPKNAALEGGRVEAFFW